MAPQKGIATKNGYERGQVWRNFFHSILLFDADRLNFIIITYVHWNQFHANGVANLFRTTYYKANICLPS